MRCSASAPRALMPTAAAIVAFVHAARTGDVRPESNVSSLCSLITEHVERRGFEEVSHYGLPHQPPPARLGDGGLRG